MRCTCSSAGPQPTLGQRSPGETNPSAAQRASGRARLVPTARGSAQPPPPPPLSQTPGKRSRHRPEAGNSGVHHDQHRKDSKQPGVATG
ncbi:hypothetical protein NN561_007600 [Cricetulus griseus]